MSIESPLLVVVWTKMKQASGMCTSAKSKCLVSAGWRKKVNLHHSLTSLLMALASNRLSGEAYRDLIGQWNASRYGALGWHSSDRVWPYPRRKPFFRDVKITWPIAFAARQTLPLRTAGVRKYIGTSGSITIECLGGRVWSDRVCESSFLKRHDMISWLVQVP